MRTNHCCLDILLLHSISNLRICDVILDNLHDSIEEGYALSTIKKHSHPLTGYTNSSTNPSCTTVVCSPIIDPARCPWDTMKRHLSGTILQGYNQFLQNLCYALDNLKELIENISIVSIRYRLKISEPAVYPLLQNESGFVQSPHSVIGQVLFRSRTVRSTLLFTNTPVRIIRPFPYGIMLIPD